MRRTLRNDGTGSFCEAVATDVGQSFSVTSGKRLIHEFVEREGQGKAGREFRLEAICTAADVAEQNGYAVMFGLSLAYWRLEAQYSPSTKWWGLLRDPHYGISYLVPYTEYLELESVPWPLEPAGKAVFIPWSDEEFR